MPRPRITSTSDEDFQDAIKIISNPRMLHKLKIGHLKMNLEEHYCPEVVELFVKTNLWDCQAKSWKLESEEIDWQSVKKNLLAVRHHGSDEDDINFNSCDDLCSDMDSASDRDSDDTSSVKSFPLNIHFIFLLTLVWTGGFR
jgi:hypothetical protein